MTRVGQLYRERLVTVCREGIEKNDNLFLVSYTKINSAKIGDLRKNLKQAGAKVSVNVNSLSRRALKDLKYDDLAGRVSGQTAFIWSNADVAAVSKILVDFAKGCETFVIQGGLLSGRVLKKEDVKTISELPSREVLLAQLLGMLQAPVSRLLGAFNAKSRDLLSILKQLSEQKGGN